MSERPWTPHKPEQRLSIVVYRFLDEALLPPCYASAEHDADEGGRTDRQRARDKDRGIKPGRLDGDIAQGHLAGGIAFPTVRKLELKRGKNKPTANQVVTIQKLTACGCRPIVAWTLREVHAGMVAAGFRFAGNVETLLQKYEAQLDALDRAAELTLSGGAPKKKARSRTAVPRYVAGKRLGAKMHARGWG